MKPLQNRRKNRLNQLNQLTNPSANRPLIIDLFAGGGGASQGIEAALGMPVDIAINHDDKAILVHQLNHPKTLHFKEDIFAYKIVDIGLRMLQPHELFKAQGFSDDYRLDATYNQRPLSKTDKVRLCGNSVCPPIAKLLVELNYRSLSQLVLRSAI